MECNAAAGNLLFAFDFKSICASGWNSDYNYFELLCVPQVQDEMLAKHNGNSGRGYPSILRSNFISYICCMKSFSCPHWRNFPL